MGKSYRKTPIFKNTTAESDKSSKKIGNQKLRGATRAALKNYDHESEDDLILPEPNEVYNIYKYDSDGKHYQQGWNRGPDKRDMSK